MGPLVLALIGQRDRYGLELVKVLSAHDLVVSEGTVYPLLSRLMTNGLVESEWLISGKDRPRRIYRLTEEGKNEVRAFRSEWDAFATSVQDVLSENTMDNEDREIGTDR